MNPMICSSVNLLFLMSVILQVDGLRCHYAGTAGRGQVKANKLIQKRMTYGPALKNNTNSKISRDAAVTPGSMIRVYQKEVQRQKFLVRRASWSQQRLLFVLGALRNLATDENFCNLLRAEGLDTVPKYLADRLIVGA
jgi:ParB family chromosome partitioning protein